MIKMETEKIIEKVKEITAEFLTQLGLDSEIEVSIQEDEDVKYIAINLEGENLSELIGFHGKVFDSVQNILGLIINKQLDLHEYRLLLEINDYRAQREEYLKQYAQRAAMEVKMNKSPLELTPMKPFERRIIHMILKDDSEVVTESTGEGNERRVIIKYKD
jgi:spoIIIJ-associated protein